VEVHSSGPYNASLRHISQPKQGQVFSCFSWGDLPRPSVGSLHRQRKGPGRPDVVRGLDIARLQDAGELL
jgi:hypothetical protein